MMPERNEKPLEDPEQKNAQIAGSSPDAPQSTKTSTPKAKINTPFKREFTRLVGMTPKEFTAGGGSAFSHVLSHAAFSFLAALAFPLAAPLLLVTALSVAAVTTETLQLFVVTRSTNLEDLGMNMLGVILGLAIVFAWRLAARQFRIRR